MKKIILSIFIISLLLLAACSPAATTSNSKVDEEDEQGITIEPENLQEEEVYDETNAKEAFDQW